MMVDRRLAGLVPGSMGYVAASAAAQWAALVASIAAALAVSGALAAIWEGTATRAGMAAVALTVMASAAIRAACAAVAARMGHRASSAVKGALRRRILEKLLRLGRGYREAAGTSEVVQVAVEGCDQLETYFGAYLPQLIYAVAAPLTLSAVLAAIDPAAALVLLACVPLIPASIAAVQAIARRLLSSYWGRYTELGEVFLESLQGLTTLKVYQADGARQREMAEQAEGFRRITMRVLTMQLNSIAVMDLVAYGGAAAGIAVGVSRMAAGEVGLAGCIAIILLAADYFIPMRQLGSLFHVAMNGMAASERIFRLLDHPEPGRGAAAFPDAAGLTARGLGLSHGDGRRALDGVALSVPAGSLVGVVGASGSGKSTLAALLTGRLRGYTGSLAIGGTEVSGIDAAALAANVTYVGHESRLFKGTVRDNLLMAAPDATDGELWDALERTRLAGFVRAEGGLGMRLSEGGSNLSGGQRQRLAVARALLRPAAVCIFDEATSNLDADGEDAVMGAIARLAGDSTVVVISHRLANVRGADRIVVMDGGRVAETGSHGELVRAGGRYAGLWRAQRELEGYGDGCGEVGA